MSTSRASPDVPLDPSRTYRNAGLAAVVGANIIWASSYTANAVALESFSPTLFTVLRLGLATLVLLPFLKLPPGQRWDRGLVVQALWLGTIGFSVPMLLQLSGQALSNAAMAALAVSLEPIFTVTLGVLVHREHLSKIGWAALLAAFLGGWAIAGFPRPGNLGFGPGDLLLVLSAACYAAYTVSSRRFAERLPARTATALVMLVGFITSVPMWLVLGHPWPATVSAGPLLALLYIALLGTAGAYFLWMIGLNRAPITLAAFTLYLQPVLGVIFALVLLGIRPAWTFYLGAGLIALALLMLRPDRMMTRDQSAAAS